MRFFALISVFLALASASHATELEATVAQTSAVLSGSLTVEAPQCNTFVNFSNCPTWMKNQLVENRGDRWRDILARNVGGMITANEGCNIAKEGLGFSATSFKNPQDLENFLANSRAGLSSPPQFLNQCLAKEGLDQVYGPDERKSLVAEFYYKMNRLRQGSHGALEAIANYDGLLGQETTFWNSDECKSDELTTARFCNEQAKCPINHISAQEEHRKTTQELTDLMPHYLKAEAELKTAQSTQCGGRRGNPQACLDAKNAKIKKLQTVLNLFQDRYPYLQAGSVFRNEFAKLQKQQGKNAPNLRLGHISVALRDQYKHDRDSTMKEWLDARKAAQCLQGTAGRNIDCDEIEQTVEKMPEYRPDFYKSAEDYPNTPEGKRLKMLHFSANYEIGSGQCVRAIRGHFQTGRSLINNFAGDVVVTIGTAGAGAYLAAARTAATTARLAQAGGQAATRFGKVAQMLKTPQGKLYAGLLGTVGAGELYFASQDFSLVADNCFAGVQNQIDVGAGKESTSCQLSRPDSTSRVAQSQVGGCLLAAGLASLNFLPVAGPALARLNKMKAPPVAAAGREVAQVVTEAVVSAPVVTTAFKDAIQDGGQHLIEINAQAIRGAKPLSETAVIATPNRNGGFDIGIDMGHPDAVKIATVTQRDGKDMLSINTAAVREQLLAMGHKLDDSVTVQVSQSGGMIAVTIKSNPLPASRNQAVVTQVATVNDGVKTADTSTTALTVRQTEVTSSMVVHTEIPTSTTLAVREGTQSAVVVAKQGDQVIEASSGAGLILRRADDATPIPSVVRRVDDATPSGGIRRSLDIIRRADSTILTAAQTNTETVTSSATPVTTSASVSCSLSFKLTLPQPTLSTHEYEFELTRSVTEGEIASVIDAKKSSANKIIAASNKEIAIKLSTGVECKGKTPQINTTHNCSITLTADPSDPQIFSAIAKITPAATEGMKMEWFGGAPLEGNNKTSYKFKRSNVPLIQLFLSKDEVNRGFCFIATPGDKTPDEKPQDKKNESKTPVPLPVGADGKLPAVINFGSEESQHLFKQGVR